MTRAAARGHSGAMSENQSTIRSICVYCGSRPGRDPEYMAAGRALGRSIAAHGLRLVYGGGTKGIMGAVASGVLSAGGQVTGIIPEFLVDMEATRHSLGQLNELIITEDMHQRKHKMFERADAFVTLPGGIGTLEEIVEIMTWGQLGQHEKPMVFANVNGFWAPMLELLNHMRQEGFVHTGHKVQPLVIDDVEAIVPTIIGRWEELAQVGAEGEGDAEVLSKL
ncbi:hypothetical protein GGQ71_001676 [Rhizobium taibaishanense]|uniref:Cytokinin riboside 5'-monophosphate phosphoribohydrolase n=2 Tax=Allorhizobium taibaishanense TaxID=887144 RepID=A0A7W6MTU0_9HYPH|nr:hypothetical protein [Allorhizobium taibaishanense]